MRCKNCKECEDCSEDELNYSYSCNKIYKVIPDPEESQKWCPLNLPETVEISTELLCEWIRQLKCCENRGDNHDIWHWIEDELYKNINLQLRKGSYVYPYDKTIVDDSDDYEF